MTMKTTPIFLVGQCMDHFSKPFSSKLFTAHNDKSAISQFLDHVTLDAMHTLSTGQVGLKVNVDSDHTMTLFQCQSTNDYFRLKDLFQAQADRIQECPVYNEQGEMTGDQTQYAHINLIITQKYGCKPSFTA
jgi:hypothetical protein